MRKSKVFLDFEKEQAWLNEMAEAGYSLIERSFFEYKFESCEKGKYIYRVEKLAQTPKEDKQSYIQFLEDLGIELVCQQFGWAYFRQEKNSNVYEIYSDVNSKVSHYKRASLVCGGMAFLSFCILMNASREGLGPWIFNISVPVVGNIILIVLLVNQMIRYYKKSMGLLKENDITQL